MSTFFGSLYFSIVKFGVVFIENIFTHADIRTPHDTVNARYFNLNVVAILFLLSFGKWNTCEFQSVSSEGKRVYRKSSAMCANQCANVTNNQ